MAATRQHVMPSLKGGWAVRDLGAVRARRVFKTQADAVAYAKDRAKADGSVLYIHGKDGMVKDRVVYGNDPFPPPDKR